MSTSELLPALRATQRAVELALDRPLGELGLSAALNGALRLVAAEPGLSAADLARRAQVRPQAAAHAVERLERLGYVKREPHPVHGRVQCLTVTTAGRDAARAGARALARTEAELLTGIDAAHQAQLRRLLEIVRDNATSIAGEAQ